MDCNIKTINKIIHLAHSIARWEIVSSGFDNLMIESCKLCNIYDTNDNDCNGCPVFEDTNRCCCEGTPYDDWWEYAYTNKMGYGTDSTGKLNEIDDKYVSLALLELNYLKRLQRKAIQEMNNETIKVAERRTTKSTDGNT